MNTPVLMLGVAHRDPRGAERLAQALAGRDFALVTVEVSALALAWRRRQGPRLLAELEASLPAVAGHLGLELALARAHPALAWLRAYLAPPYEWTACQAAAAGRPCLAIDLSATSRVLLGQAPGLVSRENLALLLSGPAPNSAEMERRRAADLLAGRGGWPRPEPPEPAREATLARRLSRLARLASRRGGPLVHVGGWEHLLPGQSPPTLADRLELEPEQRVLV